MPYTPADYEYSEIHNQQKYDSEKANEKNKASKGVYTDETAYLREGLKESVSLAAVKLARSKTVQVSTLAKYGAMSAIYNKWIEPKKKLFGFELPTLESLISKSDDRESFEIQLMAQKWLYFCAMAWLSARWMGSFSNNDAYEFALAVAARHVIGIMTEEDKKAEGG